MTWSISCSGTKDEVSSVLGAHSQPNLLPDGPEAATYDAVKELCKRIVAASDLPLAGISASGWHDANGACSVSLSVSCYAPPAEASGGV